MSPNPRERLYGNLPSFYRMRDAQEGEPLRALLGIVDGELATVQTNLEQLYNDLFIETCAEWVAPYLGELVGADRLKSAVPGGDNGRAYIANAIAYRRRKGTLGSISSLARDLTGWPAHPVEFYQLVGLTQPINHLRPANLRTPRLRNRASLHSIGTPFDRTARTIDFKPGSKASLDGIGIFLWRLTSFPFTKVCAARVPGKMGCYHFDPLGIAAPLFNPLRTTGTGALTETSAPGPIAPGPLADALEALRSIGSPGVAASANPYFDTAPPFQITIDEKQVLLTNMRVADLRLWGATPIVSEAGIEVVVDPTLGRFMIPTALADARVVVSFYRGFGSELGGGFYDRSLTIAEVPAPIKVSENAGLQTALAGLSGSANSVIVEITDSLNYAPVDLEVPAGMMVELRAANKQRPLLKQGTGTWNVTLNQDATLVLNGLLIDADLTISGQESASLSLVHCTVVPGRKISTGKASPSLSLSRCITGQILLDAAKDSLTATDCIIDGQGAQAIKAGQATLTCCTVFGSAEIPDLTAKDCIFAAEDGSDTAIGTDLDEQDTKKLTPAGYVSLTNCTVFGTTRTLKLDVKDCIFNGEDGSHTAIDSYLDEQDTKKLIPVGHALLTNCTVFGTTRTQKLEAKDCILTGKGNVPEKGKETLISSFNPGGSDLAASPCPAFTSKSYGQPGYAQLRQSCPMKIREGGSDQSEMGAFHHLYQKRRLDNLQEGLKGYLRYGLKTTLFFVT